jgi:hypothetical protein
MVLPDAPAVVVHVAEVELGVGISLRSSESVQASRLGMVLPDAIAVMIHKAEEGLGCGMSLIGGLAEPANRLRTVLPDDIAGSDLDRRRQVPAVAAEGDNGVVQILRKVGEALDVALDEVALDADN